MPLYMPQMYKKETSRSMTANFYGLNHNLKIADGEWYDMENLTSDHLPVAAVRGKRSKLIRKEKTSLNDPLSFDVCTLGTGSERFPVWITRGGMLCIADRVEIDLLPYGFMPEGEKRIVKMGAYLIVLPDWIYVNTATISDGETDYEIGRTGKDATWGKHEDEGKEYILKISVCDSDGNGANAATNHYPPGGLAGEDIEDGYLWHYWGDLGDSKLYRYYKDTDEWKVIVPYIKISLQEKTIETGKEEPIYIRELGNIYPGDVIEMKGDRQKWWGWEVASYLNKPVSVAGINYETITFKEGREQQAIKEIWISGIIQGPNSTITLTEDQKFTLKFATPEMTIDTVFESDNRLWGAGIYYDEKKVIYNEVYCSARGDFSRWYAGPSDNDDSPVTFSVGEGGAWTGGIDHNGNPTFFKETSMIRFYGSGASSFSVDARPCEGVANGAERSLAEINGALYYKGKEHIMRYDGSVPQSISEKLGRMTNKSGKWRGVKNGLKYYLASDSEDGQMLVFNTEQGIWTMENAVSLLMASTGDNIYCAKGEEIIAFDHEKGKNINWEEEPNPVMWYAESGIIGLETPDEKYLTKLAIRLKLEAGAHVRVLIQYDSSGEWQQVMATEFVGMRTVTVPVHPHKYDHMRYRLEGEGDCKIFSVTKTLERAGRR